MANLLTNTLVLLIFYTAGLTAIPLPTIAEPQLPENLAIDIAAWSASQDGGRPVSVVGETSIQVSGSPALRIIYRNEPPGYGNAIRQVLVPPTTRSIFLKFYKHSSAKSAALHLWLLEPDGDRWVQQVQVDGVSFGSLDKGWHETSVAVGQFLYEAKGDGKMGLSNADRLLIGCNYGDLDISISDLRFVLAGETPGKSPAALPPPPPEDGLKGRIAILAENFVERLIDQFAPVTGEESTEKPKNVHPGASDPEWLAEMCRRSGYGATLLSASSLESPGYLSINNFDVLVIPSAPYYPLSAQKQIQSFLQSGGSLFSTGGYAFDRPCVRAGDGWQTVEEALTVEDVDKGIKTTGLNHRLGIPADGVGPSDGQLGLFDPANPLLPTVKAESVVDFIPKVAVDGPFEGWAASALLGNNDPVFPQAYAVRIPLLMGKDAFGRDSGALGQIVHHFAGPFKQSSWAAFGVTNKDLFARTAPLSIEFGDILDRIVDKVYGTALQTDVPLYEKGETARLTVNCVNFSKNPVNVLVKFEVTGIDGIPAGQPISVEKEIQAGFQETLEAQWPLPATAGMNFFLVRCYLSAGFNTQELQTAFCVYDETLRASGPKIELKDNYFLIDGKRSFLTGTNQTGAMFVSLFEDPLVWDKDFAAMRAHGMSIMRVLHFSPFVKSSKGDPATKPTDLGISELPRHLKRKLDAIVQLAAKRRIVLMLTLHDWMEINLTDEELAAQRKFAAVVAKAYADCPHVIFDIQNEPEVRLVRVEEDTKLWNRFLSQKYGSSEALNAAWMDYVGGETFGAISLTTKGPNSWQNLRQADIGEFKAWLLNRWLSENIGGIREGGKALSTIGFIQYMSHADQLTTTSSLDYTNKHSYDVKSEFTRQIKIIDRRFEGKSLSVGEFGSVIDHKARLEGKTPRWDADWYAEALLSTMGIGGSFALNWCWKEMPDNVFPWGINSPNDNIPRPTLLAMRSFKLFSGGFAPGYIPPQVYLIAPDSSRMGPQGKAIDDALYRAIDALRAQRVDFGVINEGSLEKLPEQAKVLFLPVPYALSDTAYELLKAFVAKGGKLYVSGDISFDTFRKRTKSGRLNELFGLELAGVNLQPVQANAEGKTESVLELKVTTAVEEQGLYSNTAGTGKVWFNPVPVELTQTPHQTYQNVLKAAGVAAYPVEPFDFGLYVYRVAATDPSEELYVLQNSTGKIQTIKIGSGLVFPLEAGHKAAVVLKSGKPIALYAMGVIEIGGEPWAVFEAPTWLVSLDGKTLDQSTAFGASVMGSAALRLLKSTMTEPEVWVGQIKSNVWQTDAIVRPQVAGGLVVVPAQDSLAHAMFIIGSKSELTKAGEQAARNLLDK